MIDYFKCSILTRDRDREEHKRHTICRLIWFLAQHNKRRKQGKKVKDKSMEQSEWETRHTRNHWDRNT